MPSMFDQIGNGINNNIIKPVAGYLSNGWNNSPAKAIANSPGAKQFGEEMKGVGNWLTSTTPQKDASGKTVIEGTGNYAPKTTSGLINTTNNIGPVSDASTYSGMLGGKSTPTTTSSAPAKTEQQLHDEKVQALSDQIKSKQKELKTQQEGIANGTMDANGSPIQQSTNNSTPPPYQPPKSDAYNTNVKTLTDIAKNGTPEVQSAMDTLKKAQDKYNIDILNNIGKAQTAGDLTGSENVLNVTDQRAITNALAIVNAYQTSQGQQISAAQNAGGLTQPQGNTAYFGSPESGQIVQTNQGGGNFPGATGNTLIDNTVQEALKQVAAGGDPTNNPGFDAVKALNSPQAVNAYNQGVAAIKGGTYNPTTASATAQTNASQAATYAKQASDLDVTLKTLGSIGNLTTSFLQSTGLNPDTSLFLNAMQNKTIGQLKNPSNVATYNDLVNQVQTYATQIYQSTGMTPTDAGMLAKGINIDGMTGNALNSFLGNLDTIGRKKWDELDKASKSAASSPGAYTGSSSSGNSTLKNASDSNQYYGQGNPRAEQLGGLLSTFTGDIVAAGSALLKLIGQ